MRRTVTWSISIVLVIACGIGQARYLTNFVNGPFDLTAAELAAVSDVDNEARYFVRISGSKAVDTGLQQVKIRKRGGVETSRSVSAAYYVLIVEDRLLLVKGATTLPTTVEGELKRMSPDIENRLFNTPEMWAARSQFVPFYLDTGSFREPGYWAIGAVAVFVLLYLWLGIPAWRQLKDPSSHPVVQRASKWGDPLGVAIAAEREYPAPAVTGGGWKVTDNFLIRSTFFTFDILRLQDLVWAYKAVTKHSWNFIPTGKTYNAVLICYGGGATIKTSEKRTEDILGFASRAAPWAIIGFSDELSKYFQSNQSDFCAAVEKRRQEYRKTPA
jgi:hypothetical protein